MKEGKPTYEQMCRIVGSIYADAYLRLEFLEKENRQLREDQQKLVASMESVREERDRFKAKLESIEKWKFGKGNCTSPALSPAEPESMLMESSST